MPQFTQAKRDFKKEKNNILTTRGPTQVKKKVMKQ